MYSVIYIYIYTVLHNILYIRAAEEEKTGRAVAIRQQGPVVYCAIVLWSDSSKSVLMLELIVPWEERMEHAFEWNRKKYEELRNNCQKWGWSVGQVLALGGRVSGLCRPVALQGWWRAIHIATDAAEKASRWLWLKEGRSVGCCYKAKGSGWGCIIFERPETPCDPR